MRSVLLLIPVVVAIYCRNINETGAGRKLLTVVDDDEFSTLKCAVLEIFSENFHDFTTVVNFVMATEDMEAVRELMKELSGNFSVILEEVNEIKQQKKRKKEFCVFFVDSHASFRKIFDKMTTDVFHFHGYYLVIYLRVHFEFFEASPGFEP